LTPRDESSKKKIRILEGELLVDIRLFKHICVSLCVWSLLVNRLGDRRKGRRSARAGIH